VDVGCEINIAAVAAVTAARPAARNILFPAKGDAAMTAIACFDRDFGFVDEQCYSTGWIEMNLPVAPLFSNCTIPGIFANKVSSLPMPTLRPALNLVPRCRTKIDPPVTSWPAKRFTPRRWELLSRPLRELPTPFL
jgi:hypothetical protein